jgi:FolB domain-containing protein
MDQIRVIGLELRCIVGLRSYERRREQPLTVDISLGLDLSSAGRSGQITDSVDYSIVADEVTTLLRFREYRLLEAAAEEAAALLF